MMILNILIKNIKYKNNHTRLLMNIKIYLYHLKRWTNKIYNVLCVDKFIIVWVFMVIIVFNMIYLKYHAIINQKL